MRARAATTAVTTGPTPAAEPADVARPPSRRRVDAPGRARAVPLLGRLGRPDAERLLAAHGRGRAALGLPPPGRPEVRRSRRRPARAWCCGSCASTGSPTAAGCRSATTSGSRCAPAIAFYDGQGLTRTDGDGFHRWTGGSATARLKSAAALRRRAVQPDRDPAGGRAGRARRTCRSSRPGRPSRSGASRWAERPAPAGRLLPCPRPPPRPCPLLDTVAVAAEDPHREQPWADLGLKADEYARIREILGRRPTSSELAMYSVMWSEHCSYKSSKVHLKQFSEIPQETPIGKMLAGIGENAGVIDIGQGYAVTFKVESHNHPSYVEPYQGAATGVGGIVRDILAMGARPVAVMDPLRFGPLDADDTHRVLPGIVAGVGGYGNCLGLPNIGGEAVFDASYLGNPLVNALCVGVLRHEDLHLAKASGVGNQVILYGAKTGGDGIGGVSHPGQRDLREHRPGQAAQRPGRRPVHGEAAHRVHPRAVRGRAGQRHPGPRRRRPLLRDVRAGQRRRRRHARRARHGPAARLHARAGGDPDERVAGADDGGRRARRRRRVPRDLRQVGGRRDRRRRGHRHRPAPDRLARRAGRRRTAAQRRARRADLPAPVRAARRRRTRCRPTAPRRCRGRPPARSCARRCSGWPAAPTSATSRGSPTSTTATSAATPCSPSPPTAG